MGRDLGRSVLVAQPMWSQLLERIRKKSLCKFKANLGTTVSSGPGPAIKTRSQNKKVKRELDAKR